MSGKEKKTPTIELINFLSREKANNFDKKITNFIKYP